jgi:hypothetical protein
MPEQHPIPTHHGFRNLSGRIFGRLIVIEFVGIIKNFACWKCRCECGTVSVKRANSLLFGGTRSCGCLKRDKFRKLVTKHGAHNSDSYGVWKGLKKRCTRPDRPDWPNYGGRGITVCERWQDFSAFASDMGPRPSKRHSIERINNDGNYEPGNCRWATQKEQANNIRRNVRFNFDGEFLSLEQLTQRMTANIGPKALFWRLKSGWPVHLALTLPCRSKPPLLGACSVDANLPIR